MTQEENKAITYVKKDLEKAITLELQIVNTDRFSVETILNIINKQQKEIEKKDKTIKEMAYEIANTRDKGFMASEIDEIINEFERKVEE